MISNLNIPEELRILVQKVEQNKAYSQFLEDLKDKYSIRGTNINSLTPYKVLQMYSIIRKKFYYERKSPANCSWFQNQLRIYIWVLICYLYVNNKEIQSMTFEDWSFFKPIFYQRDPTVFQFQGILLLKNKNSKWEDDQIQLLDGIVKIKAFKNKWNSIARELYILSDKRFVKTPKQCRQRWLNYLDPSKVHCPWTSEEDLILLSSIQENGKRWAFTVRKLLKKRTEHMVKNRFNSLINIEKKRIGNKSQVELLASAIRTIKSSLHLRQDEQKIKIEEGEGNCMDEQESQSLFVVKRKAVSEMQRRKKGSKSEHASKLPSIRTLASIPSIPTGVNLQIKMQSPAEIIKIKVFQQKEGIQFMEENSWSIGFNPFEEFSPNHSLMAQNNFLFSQLSQSCEEHQKLPTHENDNGERRYLEGSYRFC